jgi:hypothetical protein
MKHSSSSASVSIGNNHLHQHWMDIYFWSYGTKALPYNDTQKSGGLSIHPAIRIGEKERKITRAKKGCELKSIFRVCCAACAGTV